MKKNRDLAKELLNIAILLAPVIFALLKWDSFPKRIPVHFDLAGNPNGYSGKIFGLLGLPCINAGLYFFLLLLPRIDPRNENYEFFRKQLAIIRLLLTSFLSFIMFASMLRALGYHVAIAELVCYGVAVFMLVIGNYLGTIRSNFFIGIRTPWTLSSDEVWVRTHRMAGRLWVICSLLYMLSGLFLPLSILTLFLYIFIIALVPIVYSYVIYKKIKKDGEGGSGNSESGS
jgi:uncharacterized membrane protein